MVSSERQKLMHKIANAKDSLNYHYRHSINAFHADVRAQSIERMVELKIEIAQWESELEAMVAS